MRANYRKRVRELFDQGFSILELSIMYHTSIFKVEDALEQTV